MPKAGPGLSLPRARFAQGQRGGLHRLSKNWPARSEHYGAFRRHSGGRAEHSHPFTEHSELGREHCRTSREHSGGPRSLPGALRSGSLRVADRSLLEVECSRAGAGRPLPGRNVSLAPGNARDTVANVSERPANVRRAQRTLGRGSRAFVESQGSTAGLLCRIGGLLQGQSRRILKETACISCGDVKFSPGCPLTWVLPPPSIAGRCSRAVFGALWFFDN